MAQGVLGFQYEVEERDGGMTALAGLPAYVELAHVLGLRGLIGENVRPRQGDQGWTDEQMVMSLVLLNLAGGDCVEDLRVLEGDEGFCRVLREAECYGLSGSQKRALKRRWRKERTRDGAVSYGDAGVSGAVSRQGARRFEGAPYCIYSRADCCFEGFGEDERGLGCRGSASISQEYGHAGHGCDLVRDP